MKDLKKIYENLSFETANKEEGAIDFYNMAKEDHGNDPAMMALIMFSYGKMVGKRKERAKKSRAYLLKKYPEMRDLIIKASDKAIHIMNEMQKLTQEERDAYEVYLNHLLKEKKTLSEETI